MTINTYPKLTDAKQDTELIRFWISQKSKTTQKTYITISRQFLTFAGKELEEVKLEDILLWLESFQLRGKSQNTINNKLAAIKSLFSFGVKTGYLPANPASMIKTTKAKDALNERILQAEEVKQLINEAAQMRDRLILVLLYILGLRISELVGLNWSDFQPTDEAIAVTIFGKGHKTRTLLITHQLYSELKQLPSSEKTEAVFLSRFGNRLDRHAIHRLIKKAVEKAGINPHTSAHWLRHAHACHSLNNGAGIDLLMKSLGHSSLAVTSRYLHVKPSECTSKFIDLS
ncbi:Integrase [Hyella patelloides LEGE 07179]|uniref:Integrase n=1 Tax=Hyella patelloides LEGE 07179 TaxID=945734 RepID=A0A563VTK4_9CYAN|nr:tyrosine-type recombinase/integrase [Hyella patelloides]VEP14745.1 Integrase [Hyella patelloides LEGE 07179]